MSVNRYSVTKQKQELSEAAKEARRQAAREWRKKNRDKTKEYTRRYWEKKAAEARGDKVAEKGE